MKKDRKDKEEVSEDYCFICKDGGLLLVCDYKNCLKAYHTSCVNKDDTFLDTDEHWTCGWHTCSNCQKSSTFQCFCCPSSFCRACIKGADFVQVKKKMKGFCGHCLKLAILIEENVDVDSDGEKVDFNDTSTYEFLFKDYWEIVKEKEGLTLVDLHAADTLRRRGETYKSESDLDKFPEEELISEDDDELADKCENEIFILDDMKEKCHKMRTRLKRSRSKKKNFIGWGSEELLQFLASIGKDTSKPLSQLDACEIVKDYIQVHKLFHPAKKKRIVCDDKLHSLFHKRSMKFHKIYSLLESHFAENDDSDGYSPFNSEGGGDLVVNTKQRRKTSDSRTQKSEPGTHGEKVLVPHKNCYASIVDKNIQSVYLRRSLILKFLKDYETFEHKVVGCFVRVKSDPNDFYYSPEKPYQLGQVIGIKKAIQAYKLRDTSTDIVLRVTNMFNDIQISMLSDDDIEEEEFEDLHQLMKKGLFKRPTVVYLQEKIRIVHEDITNHWIDREIVKLQRQIDRANVNGWRRERFEHIERRNLLCTPAERTRLLKEMPTVIADTEEEITATTIPINFLKGGNGIHDDDVRVPANEPEGPVSSVEASAKEFAVCYVTNMDSPIEEPESDGFSRDLRLPVQEPEDLTENDCGSCLSPSALDTQEIKQKNIREINESSDHANILNMKGDAADSRAKTVAEEIVSVDEEETVPFTLKNEDFVAFTEVAEKEFSVAAAISETDKVWHYIDPNGNKQGPFDLISLRCWADDGYFDDDFRVWRSGEPKESAILLLDAFQLTTPP